MDSNSCTILQREQPRGFGPRKTRKTTSLSLLTAPDADHAILPSLDEEAVLERDSLNDAQPPFEIRIFDSAGATVPVPTICLVIDLDDVLACRGGNAPRVKAHRRDGAVVSKGIVDMACAEIPDLCQMC